MSPMFWCHFFLSLTFGATWFLQNPFSSSTEFFGIDFWFKFWRCDQIWNHANNSNRFGVLNCSWFFLKNEMCLIVFFFLSFRSSFANAIRIQKYEPDINSHCWSILDFVDFIFIFHFFFFSKKNYYLFFLISFLIEKNVKTTHRKKIFCGKEGKTYLEWIFMDIDDQEQEFFLHMFVCFFFEFEFFKFIHVFHFNLTQSNTT